MCLRQPACTVLLGGLCGAANHNVSMSAHNKSANQWCGTHSVVNLATTSLQASSSCLLSSQNLKNLRHMDVAQLSA